MQKHFLKTFWEQKPMSAKIIIIVEACVFIIGLLVMSCLN